MKRHLFRRMGRFLRPQAPSLVGAAALAALSGLLALLVPLVAGWAVEAIGTGPGAADLTAVLRCCAAGLGAAVLSAVCSYGASAALVRVGQTVSYTLRKAAFQQITQLPVRYFDTHPAGDLISRVCYDVDTVNAALERLRRGRTCFLIAHRLATVRTADRILVLQDGRIAEQGTHQQLLDAGGIYRVLYDAQFS